MKEQQSPHLMAAADRSWVCGECVNLTAQPWLLYLLYYHLRFVVSVICTDINNPPILFVILRLSSHDFIPTPVYLAISVYTTLPLE